MTNLIAARVAQARAGNNPYVIARMEAGWLVIGDVQPLPGYCVFLADPVAESLNVLSEPERAAYARDVARAGDAILAATGAERMNYETWGNAEPALHTHLMPRYAWEEAEKRVRPACMGYDWGKARPFDTEADADFILKVRAYLGAL